MAAGSFSQIRSSELVVVHKIELSSWVVSASIVQSLVDVSFVFDTVLVLSTYFESELLPMRNVKKL
jgi:hypothetical protein